MTGPTQETRSSENLTLYTKGLEKEQKTKIQMGRRKEVIKIRAEVNKIEPKKQHKIAVKPRACSLKR